MIAGKRMPNRASASHSGEGGARGRNGHPALETLSMDQNFPAMECPIRGIIWALVIEGGIALGGFLTWCVWQVLL